MKSVNRKMVKTIELTELLPSTVALNSGKNIYEEALANPDLFVDISGVPLKRYVLNNRQPDSNSDSFVTDDGDSLFVTLSSLKSLLRLICCSINCKKPVLLQGPVGCGKSAIIQHVAQCVGRNLPPSFVTVQLGEHMDSKSLFGTYQCTEIPGEFVWTPGPLTTAALDGHWVLLEDLNCAPVDVLSGLIPLLETRSINVPNKGTLQIHDDFQLFATLRSDDISMTSSGDLVSTLLNKCWFTVDIPPLTEENMKQIVCFLHSELTPIIGRLLETFKSLSLDVRRSGVDNRQISFRDFLKWTNRICALCSLDDPISIFLECIDCFAAYIRKLDDRLKIMQILAANLNVTKEKVDYYYSKHKPSVMINEKMLTVGRCSLPRSKQIHGSKSDNFAFTRLSSLLMERLTVCVRMAEPVLLVGETGCGKTMTVQFLAKCLGKTLHVINMNQQSENVDIMGGFKPVDMQHNVKMLKERYLYLFCQTFSSSKNEKFLGHVQTCFVQSKFEELIQLMIQTTVKALNRSENCTYSNEWKQLYQDLSKISRILKRAVDGLMFSFVEGVLTKTLRNGDWILLDEINLASAETLDCLYTILDSHSRNLVLVDQNTSEPLTINSEFRLFACMNPSTDVGKKELPVGIRNRFTEFFVDELYDSEDLTILVESYLRGLSLNPDQINRIVAFYLESKTLSARFTTDLWGHSPTYSLRTLCRALSYSNGNPCGSFVRSLFEGFCLSFLTELDSQSYVSMKKMIQDFIIGKNPNTVKSVLSQQLPRPSSFDQNFVKIQGYWLECGDLSVQQDEKYILTSTVKRNLTDVARIVSARSYPVLLQGETSVGKTSLIRYLAKLTGNYCIRINNHEHTDVQEYVGTYAADANGKLKFIEGPLVQAMKKGHWIILDELNLAPPDILEALNRVLDDNRELFVAETQEVVKAHPKFLLFATQNPPGLYGGRKQLSKAFRNRFVELHFNELPFDELEQILHGRCGLPLSYAKKMVKTMQELQIYRSSTGVFAGRESYMTLRDLFRWGERYRFCQLHLNQRFFDWDQYLADQGYLLLAGRSRRHDDNEIVCQVVQKQFGRQIDVSALFAMDSQYMPANLRSRINGFEHIVWTQNLRRCAVLAGQALLYNEPVLLIGETGCGKTTLCQIFAQTKNKNLHTINCHLMTEAADFVGRISPCSSENMMKGVLFEWQDGPLVKAMQNGEPILIDEISLSDDSVLERLNSVLEPERVLLLAEMGVDAHGLSRTVEAVDGFYVTATMNPGGDYGKKELSRALRNRFTEIWCETYYNRTDFVEIIEHNIKPGLSLGNQEDGSSGIGSAIFDFSVWLTHNSPSNVKLVITIRDVLCWVKFINTCSIYMDCALAYVHGAFLTFLDGLGCSSIGASYDANDERQRFIDKSFAFLYNQIQNHESIDCNFRENSYSFCVAVENRKFGCAPFFVDMGKENTDLQNYSFNSPACGTNVFRILRAMQIGKPILLEGSPGVGKSSVVIALAKSSGNKLTRINLSEQTDLNDLFGSDIPVLLPNGCQGFAWVDGPLLAAIKNGDWLLIDELNLASQSVLEGLNACFDHRSELYIPQLGRTFKVDCSKTKFFACQNPFVQGAGRKGLPKSFINRFTLVYVNKFLSVDMRLILTSLYPTLNSDIIDKMVQFNEVLNDEVVIKRKWGHIGGPWEFNLRDLMRWCALVVNNDSEPVNFVDVLYVNRMRTESDRKEVARCFESIFGQHFVHQSLMYNITSDFVRVGDVLLERVKDNSDNNKDLSQNSELLLLHSMLKPMRSLIHCIRSNYLTILIGKSGTSKTSLIESLARISGRRLKTFHLTSETDSSDLLGCFEQQFSHLESEKIKEDFIDLCQHAIAECKKADLIDLAEKLSNFLTNSKFDSSIFDSFKEILENLHQKTRINFNDHLSEVEQRFQTFETSFNSVRFSWIDSPLVDALRNGDWLLVKNVHYCNPAVLDRLNALLEPDGVLSVAEKGLVDGKLPTYKPHPDFRIFFTMEPGARSISRAMRNRGVELFLPLEEAWFYNKGDCLTVLRLKICINQKTSLSIWSLLENLTKNGISYGASDVLKIAFIVRETMRHENISLEECTKYAIEQTLKITVPSVDDQTSQYFDFYNCSSVQIDWHAKNSAYSSVQKDFSFLKTVFEHFKGQSCAVYIKHFLWMSSTFDYELRLQVAKLLSLVFKELSFDPRWCGELSFILLKNFDKFTENGLHLSWNRLSLDFFLKWFLHADMSKEHHPDSLFGLVNDVLKGTQSEERLPDKALKLISPFIDAFVKFFENFLKCKDPRLHAIDDYQWIKILYGLFYMKHFLNLFNSPFGWDQIETEIRVLWRYVQKYLDSLLLCYGPCDELAKKLSKKWIPYSISSKIYRYSLKNLNMTEPYANFEQMDTRCRLENNLSLLNQKLKDAIINNDYKTARLVIDERVALLHPDDCLETKPPLHEDYFGFINFCVEKNLLSDTFGLFLHSYRFANKISYANFNENASSFEQCCLLLSRNYSISTCSNFNHPISNGTSLPVGLLNFCNTLNQHTTLQHIIDESDSMNFSVAALSKLPTATLIGMKMFVKSYSSSDNACKVPLSSINEFQNNLAYFASFLWRFGYAAMNLDEIIMTSLTNSLEEFYFALKNGLSVMEVKLNLNSKNTRPSSILDFSEGEIFDLATRSLQIGLALCTISTPPKKSTDHVLKSKIKAELQNLRADEVNVELDAFERYHKSITNQAMLNDNVKLDHFHPYIRALLKTRNELVEKISLKPSVYYRPSKSQFTTLVHELNSFLSSVKVFVESVQEANELSSINNAQQVKISLSKRLNFTKSIDHFVSSLRNDYPAYPDIIDPFLLGVNLIRISNDFRSFELYRRYTECTFMDTTKLKFETVENFFTFVIDGNCQEVFRCLSNVNFSNILSPSDILRLCEILLSNNKSKDLSLLYKCFEYFLYVFSSYLKSQQSDDRYYEYKPKHSNIVLEQEASEMETLFPDYSKKQENVEDVDEDKDETNLLESNLNENESSLDKLDESRFAAVFRRFIDISTSDGSVENFFETYLFAISILNRHAPALISKSRFYDDHLVASTYANSSFDEMTSSSKARRINVYKNSDLIQSAKLNALVIDFMRAVGVLLTEWSENPILTDLNNTAKKLLRLSVDTPLMKLAVDLENLLEQAQEWDIVAARQYKLETVVQPMRSLLIEWRKMEILNWENLLDDVEEEFRQSAYVCVLKFALVIDGWNKNEVTVDELLHGLKSMFLICPLGEFFGRLKALEFVCKAKRAKNDKKIRTVLTNYFTYFSSYGTKIAEQIRHCRDPVEKELKEFIKIVKFQDLNFWRMKDTGRHAHRQLFKLVRNYKTRLQNSTANYFTEFLSLPGRPFKEFSRSDILSELEIPRVKQPTADVRVRNFFKIIDRIGANLTENRSDFIDLIDSAMETVGRLLIDLRKSIAYVGTKEDKEKLHKRAFIANQNSVTDFFDVLRANGFSHRKGLSYDSSKILVKIFDSGIHRFFNEFCDEICFEYSSYANDMFWTCYSRKLCLDTVLQKPNEQIKRLTLERCSGYAMQMFSLIIDQKSIVNRSLTQRHHLLDILSSLKTFREDFSNKDVRIIPSRYVTRYIRALRVALDDVKENLHKTIDVWRCCPSANRANDWGTADVLGQFSPELCLLSRDSDQYRQVCSQLDDLYACVYQHETIVTNLEKSKRSTCYVAMTSFDDVIHVSRDLIYLIPKLDELITLSCLPGKEASGLLSSRLYHAKMSLEKLSTELSELNREGYAVKADDEFTKNRLLESVKLFLRILFVRTQKLYKTFLVNQSKLVENENEDLSMFKWLQKNQEAVGLFNFTNIVKRAERLLFMFWNNRFCDNDVIEVLERFLCTTETVQLQFFSSYVKFCTFFSKTTEAWMVLLKEGYVKPIPDIDKEGKGGDGEPTFEDLKNAGLGDGEGLKDVSDEIKDLGQVEDLQNQENKNEEQDEESKNMKDSEKPIEMEDDMDAAMEDLELNEEENESDTDKDDDNEQDEIDWKAGEADEPQDEQLDPKLWDQEPEDQENPPPLDDSAKGADELQNELAAKESDKTQCEEDNKDANQKEETEEAENDLENINLDNVQDESETEDLDDNTGEEKEENVEKIDEDDQATEENDVEDVTSLNKEERKNELQEDQSKKAVSQTGVGSAEEEFCEDENLTNENASLDNQQNDKEDSDKQQPEDRKDSQAELSALNSQKSNSKESALRKRTESDLPDDPNSGQKKRPRTEDDRKTVGDSQVSRRNNVDLVQDEIDRQTSTDKNQSDIPSQVYSHYPDLDLQGSQLFDAAPLEIARRQAADLESMDVTEIEENVDDKDPISSGSTEDNKTKQSIIDKKDSIHQVQQELENIEVDNEENLHKDENYSNNAASSIHTVLDFYTHATTSSELRNFASINIDRFLTLNQTSPDEQCKVLWSKYCTITQSLAAELSENLRLTLEPTLATKFQGDYRSGKRLNIRKLIPYVASYYRKNKIWLRRTKRAKRDYQIMLAVDDSSSMNDNKTKQLAFEALALLSNALRYLDIGQLGVCKFGDDAEVLHQFHEQFTDESGSCCINRLRFEQKNTNIISLLDFCSAYFEKCAIGSSAKGDLPAQLLLIVSDGRGIFAHGMDKVKRAVQDAVKRRIFLVFIVLDNPEHKNSILDIKVPIFAGSNIPEIRPYMEYFPFSFYVIVRRINDLPAVLGDALRQWFEILTQK